MNNKQIITYGSLLLFMFLGLTSCKKHENEYHSITDKIDAESKKYKGVTVTSDTYTNHLKLVEVTENGITFSIPERKNQIKSFACTECHTKPLSELKTKDIKKAHWNIKLNHTSNSATMNCTTCHNGSDMNHLKSITGTSIDFNKSYKLCSQCHQKEYKDWSGGAHGKAVESWAPPRVSKTCVNCHNPHDSGFKKRWPVRYNSQKNNERK